MSKAEKYIKITTRHIQPGNDINYTEAINLCYAGLTELYASILRQTKEKLDKGEITVEDYEMARDQMHDEVVINCSALANAIKEIPDTEEEKDSSNPA